MRGPPIEVVERGDEPILVRDLMPDLYRRLAAHQRQKLQELAQVEARARELRGVGELDDELLAEVLQEVARHAGRVRDGLAILEAHIAAQGWGN